MFLVEVDGTVLDRVARRLLGLSGEVRDDVAKSLPPAAGKVAAKQRAALRALTGDAGVPSDWSRGGARQLRVETTREGATLRLPRSTAIAEGVGPYVLNRGQWTHPVYGNRARLAAQRISRPGWFDRTGIAEHKTLERASGRQVDESVDRIAREIENI